MIWFIIVLLRLLTEEWRTYSCTVGAHCQGQTQFCVPKMTSDPGRQWFSLGLNLVKLYQLNVSLFVGKVEVE